MESILDEYFPDEIVKKEENNFPVWIEGCDDASFAPFVPTPLREVRRSLKMANVNKDDCLFDLGCGDGRFCLTAVYEFGIRQANGIDLDKEAIERGIEIRDKLKIDEKNVKLICDDFGNQSFLNTLISDDSITILVVVLTADFQKAFQPFLQKFIKNGKNRRRIVALYFNLNDIPGFKLVGTFNHKIYIYESDQNNPPTTI